MKKRVSLLVLLTVVEVAFAFGAQTANAPVPEPIAYTKAFVQSLSLMRQAEGRIFTAPQSEFDADAITQASMANLDEAQRLLSPYSQTSSEALIRVSATKQLSVIDRARQTFQTAISAIKAFPANASSPDEQIRIERAQASMQKGFNLMRNRIKTSAMTAAALVSTCLAPRHPGGRPKRLAITRGQRDDLIAYIYSMFPDAQSSNLAETPDPQSHLSYSSVIGTMILPVLTQVPASDQ